MNKKYAYFVMVAGKKRFGGVISAKSMDDAAQKVTKVCGLSVITPDDPRLDKRLEIDGKEANLAVWARQEDL